MAAPSTSGSAALRQPATRREPRRTRLSIVSPEHLSSSARRRRALILSVLAAVLVLGTLLVIAAAQAIVASQQIRIDGLQQSLSTATATNENLQLERANLTAPEHILNIAEHLGMVVPTSVIYLPAVNPGPRAFGDVGSVSR